MNLKVKRMITKLRFIKIISLILFSSFKLLPQDVFFSQQQFNKIYLNPAFAGFNNEASAYSNVRSQWPDVSIPYVTYSASYDQYIAGIKSGIGVYIMNDRQGGGIMNNLSASAVYSYHIQVSKNSYLLAGVQAGYEQFFQNTEKMYFGDMFDASTSSFGFGTIEKLNSRSFGNVDFASGLIFKTWDHKTNRNYQFGVSSHHLFQPVMLGGHQLKRKYTGHFYMSTPFMRDRFGRDFMYLHPHAIVQVQDLFNIINYGSLLTINNVITGVSFKNNATLDFLTVSLLGGYRWNMYTINYSFDFTPHGEKLFLSLLGIHEVTFLLNLQYKGKKR